MPTHAPQFSVVLFSASDRRKYDMFTVEATVHIEAAPDRVFEVLTDPQCYPRWIPDVVRVEAPERLQEGSRFREVTLFRGREKASEGVVTRLDPGRMLVLQVERVLSGPGLRPRRTFNLVEGGGSTTVTWRSDVATQGLMRLLEPMLPGEFRRRQHRYLALLKAEVEGSRA
jgi:uncharacterized protein YndB with AHSA1/START domain